MPAPQRPQILFGLRSCGVQTDYTFLKKMRVSIVNENDASENQPADNQIADPNRISVSGSGVNDCKPNYHTEGYNSGTQTEAKSPLYLPTTPTESRPSQPSQDPCGQSAQSRPSFPELLDTMADILAEPREGHLRMSDQAYESELISW
jgi:hypothetical protein